MSLSPLVDAHVHLYWPAVNRDPAGWAAARGETGWAGLATRRRRSGRPVQGFPSVEELLREMDAAGIGRAVLLGWYWQTAESCRDQNEFYAACVAAHPDRLSAAVTLYPPAGVGHVDDEIRRGGDAGLEALGELSPHAQGYAVSHPGLARALEAAGGRQWPVVLHVTDPMARPYPGQVATPLEDFAELARRFPRTDFILAHWGGVVESVEPVVPTGCGGENGWGPPVPPNVYHDTAASPLSYEAGVWRRRADALGADRILFGSDFPLALYPADNDGPGLSRLVAEAAAGLSAEEWAAIGGGNARRWFGRPAGRS